MSAKCRPTGGFSAARKAMIAETILLWADTVRPFTDLRGNLQVRACINSPGMVLLSDACGSQALATLEYASSSKVLARLDADTRERLECDLAYFVRGQEIRSATRQIADRVPNALQGEI